MRLSGRVVKARILMRLIVRRSSTVERRVVTSKGVGSNPTGAATLENER